MQIWTLLTGGGYWQEVMVSNFSSKVLLILWRSQHGLASADSAGIAYIHDWRWWLHFLVRWFMLKESLTCDATSKYLRRDSSSAVSSGSKSASSSDAIASNSIVRKVCWSCRCCQLMIHHSRASEMPPIRQVQTHYLSHGEHAVCGCLWVNLQW